MITKFEDTLELIYAASRQEWRQWLIENYSTAIGIWLVYYKIKSSKASIKYSEAVKEAFIRL